MKDKFTLIYPDKKEVEDTIRVYFLLNNKFNKINISYKFATRNIYTITIVIINPDPKKTDYSIINICNIYNKPIIDLTLV